MEKAIRFKPKYFSIRINLMAFIVIVTTVLTLSISDIDKGTYSLVASPIIFTFIVFLLHSNRIEVQSLILNESKLRLSFFNQNSVFFKSPVMEVDRNDIRAEVKDKKIVLFSNDQVVGILRIPYLENIDNSKSIDEYFYKVSGDS